MRSNLGKMRSVIKVEIYKVIFAQRLVKCIHNNYMLMTSDEHTYILQDVNNGNKSRLGYVSRRCSKINHQKTRLQLHIIG